ncbi:MAG: LLM class flavin-dependent oxidoreductase [Actinobacteria bacterium]|nr:LLM class flavin-dependent oxidoreductase [Actinomycetota bacterium]
MPLLTMRHDFRAPAFGAASPAEIYGAALDMFHWADAQGWDFAVVSEHHGLDDGWLPAPLTLAAVVAGATSRIPIFVSALIVPLHDPVRVAEQLAVLDLASGGRVWTVAAAGYRPEEFEMAGVERTRRGRLLEEHVEVILKAWTGEPFEWQGRTIRVTPKPLTQPHPTLMIGGGVEAAARRAARLRLPMMPMNTDPRLTEWYADEAAKVGFEGGFVMVPEGPTYVHVTHDPERTWDQIGEYLLYEAQTYAGFQTGGQVSTPMIAAASVDDLKASRQIVVGTPDEVVSVAEAVPPTGTMTFNPLAGGLPPEIAWESLELFAAEVMPRIRPAG